MAVLCDFSGGILDYDDTVDVSISVRHSGEPKAQWVVMQRHHVGRSVESEVLALTAALFDRERGSTALVRLTEALRPTIPEPAPKKIKPKRAPGTGRTP